MRRVREVQYRVQVVRWRARDETNDDNMQGFKKVNDDDWGRRFDGRNIEDQAA